MSHIIKDQITCYNNTCYDNICYETITHDTKYCENNIPPPYNIPPPPYNNCCDYKYYDECFFNDCCDYRYSRYMCTLERLCFKCPKLFNCYIDKCCCDTISICLEVFIEDIGDNKVEVFYKVFNNSCRNLCGCLVIDSQIFCPFVEKVNICPKDSIVIKKCHNVKKNEKVDECAAALFQLDCNNFIYSPPAFADVKECLNNIDLTGNMKQNFNNGLVTAEISFINLLTNVAENVFLKMMIPNGATEITGISPSESNTLVFENFVYIYAGNVGSPINVIFTYRPTGPPGTEYIWAGIIQSRHDSQENNKDNNIIKSSIIPIPQ